MNPEIRVGILQAPRITILISHTYLVNGVTAAAGTALHFECSGNSVACNGIEAASFTLKPCSPEATATVLDVTIGIGFHWQQHEDQQFKGSFEIIRSQESLIAINSIDIELYLQSVIASEMNAGAPAEFLKAHAVISRSWALAQTRHSTAATPAEVTATADETVRWYDHAAHTLFDVCADDHCQRYQGCAKASTPQTAEAIAATRGEVLTYGGEICDARFSKCCGGITERFSTCWQPADYPYLEPVSDTPEPHDCDCSSEQDARRWIESSPAEPFCANPPEELLATVLNTYDRSTPHLYRWRVDYTADQLSQIIRQRTGSDFGRIIDMQPLHRGPSGRIDRLRITGTLRTHIFGKELEIRRTLSTSHLYSSAFTVERHDIAPDGTPGSWTLHGAGWGHGVGLCQIGAAVMATRGYDYRQILAHYFRGSEITAIY